MKKVINDLWNILEDYEDLHKYGYRSTRRKPFSPEMIHNFRHAARPSDNTDGESLEKIAAEISECRKCHLCRSRKNTVPGAGADKPRVLIIGEGPGAEEDNQGLPFVGAAGKYLDKWIEAIGLDRSSDCFIGNIVKCRPPGNRDPQPDEIEACRNYLERQIKNLKPETIFTLGRISSRIITGHDEGIGRLRGKVYSYMGIPVIVTYHPSAVLRDRSYRPAVWEDLKLLKDTLEKIV